LGKFEFDHVSIRRGKKGGGSLLLRRYPGKLMFRRWDHESKLWSVAKAIYEFDDVFNVSITRDSRDTLWLAFTGDSGAAGIGNARYDLGQFGKPKVHDTCLYVAKSSDRGDTWSQPIPMTDCGESIWQPDILVTDDTIYFAYTRITRTQSVICVETFPKQLAEQVIRGTWGQVFNCQFTERLTCPAHRCGALIRDRMWIRGSG
jgi:hypothetical protein